MESATENIPPMAFAQVRLKRSGKSTPHKWQYLWQCKPYRKQIQVYSVLVFGWNMVECYNFVVIQNRDKLSDKQNSAYGELNKFVD